MKDTKIKNTGSVAYNKNADLLYAAAQSLGYTTQPLKINGQTDLSKLGFTVHAHGKICYISGVTLFPTVPHWQSVFMKDKALTASLLKQFRYNQIPTTIFPPHSSGSTRTIRQALSKIKLPVVVKPDHGLDGKGIINCTSYAAAMTYIKKLHDESTTAVVQPYVDAPEYRIFVAGQKIAFIHRKKYPEIIGDGIHRINELVQQSTCSDPHTVNEQCRLLALKPTNVLPAGVVLRTHFTKKTDPQFIETKSFGTILPTYIKQFCQDLSIDTVGLDVFFKGTVDNPGKITIIEPNSNPALNYLNKYYKNNTIAFTTAQTILKNYFTAGAKR